MAFFYLIRHGEPDYCNMLEKGFYGFGRSFTPLSETGVKQAEKIAKDKRLKTAELIVSSPYTRALQTAAIISRETGLKINATAHSQTVLILIFIRKAFHQRSSSTFHCCRRGVLYYTYIAT